MGTTLDLRIDVRHGMNLGHGKFDKKTKYRALNQYLRIAQKSNFPLYNKEVGPEKTQGIEHFFELLCYLPY